MKMLIILLVVLIVPLTFAGCIDAEMQNDEMLSKSTPISPGMIPPMLFVEDMLFLPGVAPQYIPELSDEWVFVGEIQSWTTHHNTAPSEHLQSNYGHIPIGARAYHSLNGRIRVSRSRGGIYSYREIYGDSIIVIANGEKHHYVSNEIRSKLNELLADVTW